MTTPSRPDPHCPLCDRPNGCAVAQAERLDVACWCRSARVDAEALARVAAAVGGDACLCAACLAALPSAAGRPLR